MLPMNKYLSKEIEQAFRQVFESWNKETVRQGFKFLQTRAEENDGDVCALLGQIYNGSSCLWGYSGLPKDEEKAFYWSQQAVRQGSPLGIVLALRVNGCFTPALLHDLPMSLKEAFTVLCQAGEAGDEVCCCILGNIYYWQDYGEISPNEMAEAELMTEAIGWYERSLAAGITCSAQNLCDCYLRRRQLEDVVRVSRRAAELGNPVMQCKYGIWLQAAGRKEEGFRCFLQAAAAGEMDAYWLLYDCYFYGKGITQDPEQALCCLEAAAQSGVPKGMLFAAYHYWGLFGGTRDWARTAYWLAKLNKTKERQEGLPLYGYVLLHGYGLEQDTAEGVKYLQEALAYAAAEASQIYSREEKGILYSALGYAFEKGYISGQPELSKACHYYELAEAEGSSEGKERLACFFNKPTLWSRLRHRPAIAVSNGGSVASSLTYREEWPQGQMSFMGRNRYYTSNYNVPLVIGERKRMREGDQLHFLLIRNFPVQSYIAKLYIIIVSREKDKYVIFLFGLDEQKNLILYRKTFSAEDCDLLLETFLTDGQLPALSDWEKRRGMTSRKKNFFKLQVGAKVYRKFSEQDISAAVDDVEEGAAEAIYLTLAEGDKGIYVYRYEAEEKYLVHVWLPGQGWCDLFAIGINSKTQLNFWLITFFLEGRLPQFDRWGHSRYIERPYRTLK